jgi:subfamily B ATP-binding cassette protein MsbA
VMLFRGAFDFVGTYLLNWVGLRTVSDLRVRMFAQLQRLSLGFYSGTRAGDLISRVNIDTAMIQSAISNTVEDLVREPVVLVSVVGYLLYKNWQLTIGGLIWMPVCLVPVLIFGRRTRRASRAAQEHQASVVSVLHEAIGGMRVIRAFGGEARETEDFAKLCLGFVRQRMRVVRARALSSPLVDLSAGLGAALIFLYAHHAHLKGSEVLRFASGLFLLYAPVKKLGRVHLQIQEAASGAERIYQLLDEQPSVVEALNARPLPRFQQAIRFDKVSFRYEQDAVLNDVSFIVPSGSLTAIVGASGAGKSTIFSLLIRFYDPTAGSITIDGMDTRQAQLRSLRDQFGLVTQETFLFNDTVANNIAYGKPNASREEIIAAAARAHAHEFISQMPQQYDTLTGDLGVKMSGGQRQRLAIARAILNNPPILLLDEATSALDTESERLVQKALDELMWGNAQRHLTMLVIAHRLSTVQHADCIIVLDKGRIVEQGTHAELLQRGQTYRRLHDLQFQI